MEQREYWQVALASIGDAVILTDTAGLVTYMNQAAESLCGWSNAVAASGSCQDSCRFFSSSL